MRHAQFYAGTSWICFQYLYGHFEVLFLFVCYPFLKRSFVSNTLAHITPIFSPLTLIDSFCRLTLYFIALLCVAQRCDCTIGIPSIDRLYCRCYLYPICSWPDHAAAQKGNDRSFGYDSVLLHSITHSLISLTSPIHSSSDRIINCVKSCACTT